LVFKQPKPGVNNTPAPGNTSNSSNKPAVDPALGSIPVKVVKIEGQKIIYSSFNQEKTVTVEADAKIVKLVEEKGVFKEVRIKLSDIKPSQFIQITFGSSASQATMIKLLQ